MSFSIKKKTTKRNQQAGDDEYTDYNECPVMTLNHQMARLKCWMVWFGLLGFMAYQPL